jgi:hypothetical protein
MRDIEVSFDGQVRGRINYHLTSTCVTDFTNYPEDHNDCCMTLQSANEYESQLRFDVEKTKSGVSPGQTVTYDSSFDRSTKSSGPISDWKIEVNA